MTQQEIRHLAAYSAWASNRVFDALAPIPGEDLMRDLKSSHKSIHGTLVHMVSAERIWLARVQGAGEAPILEGTDVPALASLRTVWEQVGYDMARFLGGITDKKLQESVTARSPKGETYSHTIGQVISHVVDHSTYHRGQVITLMRQLGVVPPNTGMITFFRETSKLR
jgi:uncharacterized damage-inducible protein DinB